MSEAPYEAGKMSDDTPIPVVISCPLCTEPHVDEGEWAVKPHRSHLCAYCGCIWRVADVPTVGVHFAKTRGNADTWP